jgi:hypothetical protein
MSPTTPAPSPSTASLLPLRFPRVPRVTLPHPAIVATLVDMARAGYPTATPDCPDCDNTGLVVEGVYGGKVVYVSGCPECGREGQ